MKIGPITPFAALLAISSSVVLADFDPQANKVKNVAEYEIMLNQEQRSIDEAQRTLDRRQARLDRYRSRMRADMTDSSWRFKQLDANDDGKVSEAESQGMPAVARRFSSLDDNKDGVLSSDEFSNITVRWIGERQ